MALSAMFTNVLSPLTVNDISLEICTICFKSGPRSKVTYSSSSSYSHSSSLASASVGFDPRLCTCGERDESLNWSTRVQVESTKANRLDSIAATSDARCVEILEECQKGRFQISRAEDVLGHGRQLHINRVESQSRFRHISI